jgi:prophage regulatory protein
MYENSEFLRVKQIIKPHGLLPISSSTWWLGVKNGKFPKPITHTVLGSKMTLWRKKDINQLLIKINSEFGD